MESIVRLIDQLHRVRDKQDPASAAFRVHDCRDGFSRASGVIKKCDCLTIVSHGFQRIQRLLLILPEL